ncbi:hypothetical protein SZ54_1421 [Rhizobium sp. UR51a]|nr:hypothetical protein SZ54_1421 [Rhizobium sp. UR51a]
MRLNVRNPDAEVFGSIAMTGCFSLYRANRKRIIIKDGCDLRI